ncbi:MAG: uridine kinase [Candidatus Omnitrophota bacterium]
MIIPPSKKEVRIPVAGLCGGSGGGKSVLAKRLRERAPYPICVIGMDRYYRDLSPLSKEERGRMNFDCPEAVDGELFLKHLSLLSEGYEIFAPVYDFAIHARRGEERLAPGDLILAEGALLFAFAEIRARLDLAAYCDAPDDIRLLRRIRRDIAERGRDIESIARQYLETVRPMYEKYVAPYKLEADVVLDGRKPVKELAEELLRRLAPLVANR